MNDRIVSESRLSQLTTGVSEANADRPRGWGPAAN